MLRGVNVPIVSQTEIEPMKTALSLMLALVTTRALTEPLPVAKPQSPALASVCLDVGGPDHLAPLLGIVGDELAHPSTIDRLASLVSPRTDADANASQLRFCPD